MADSPASFIASLSRFLVSKNGSDIHLIPGRLPMIRIDGELEFVTDFNELTPQFVSEVSHYLMKKVPADNKKDALAIDLSFVDSNKTRYRVNVYKSSGHFSVAMRYVSDEIPTQEELGLPDIVFDITKRAQGFFLVVGSAGMGKSTTLASMIEYVNQEQAKHIITIEDPIEYVFKPGKSIVSQREILYDVHTFSDGLKMALRQDPDVVLVGEMRDYETISSALTLAETGHLVMSTLHTNTASQAIDRMIDVFPEYQQGQIRSQIASTLVGVVSQRLVPRKDGGRVLAYEIMMVNSAIRNLIRENKVFQIDSFIDTGKDEGMHSLEYSLAALVNASVVSIEDAQFFVTDMVKFERYLKKKK